MFVRLLLGLLPWLVIISGSKSCNFKQWLRPGSNYAIQNYGYPKSYASGSRCRWVLETNRWDQRVQLTCNHFNIPWTRGCWNNKLEITDGNKRPAAFCGGKGFTFTSHSSVLTLNLVSFGNSQSGKFSCTARAVLPKTCVCGIRNAPKIHGGTETAMHEYPFMAALINVDSHQLFCGATIINEKQVLTAAHCVNGKTRRHSFGVLVGAHNLKKVKQTPGARFLLAETFVVHRSYDRKDSDYDIALVTVAGRFQFNEFISPVCLPFHHRHDTFVKKYTDVLGWGADHVVGGPLNILMKARLWVTETNDCKKEYPRSSWRQMCTYSPTKDSCGFDSGGPLVIQAQTTRRVFQIGIISKGPACGGGSTALNLRVGALIDWIVEHTPRYIDYCQAE